MNIFKVYARLKNILNDKCIYIFGFPKFKQRNPKPNIVFFTIVKKKIYCMHLCMYKKMYCLTKTVCWITGIKRGQLISEEISTIGHQDILWSLTIVWKPNLTHFDWFCFTSVDWRRVCKKKAKITKSVL